MKIGLMSRWNIPCGVSIHAELVGRDLVARGHQLKVFAPLEYGHTSLTQKDEPWVRRIYRLNPERFDYQPKESLFFDSATFLEEDYDAFIVEGLGLMLSKELLKIFPEIKEKSKTYLVIHESCLGEIPNCNKFDWNKIICFDKRYRNFLIKVFPPDKIKIIPYPCHPMEIGDKKEAREKLGLPLEKRIIFIYGLDVHRYLHLIPLIERVNRRYPLLFLVITTHRDWFDLFNSLKNRYSFIEARRKTQSLAKLYQYLHASDVLLLHKDNAPGVVLSSTAHLALGSGCPILGKDTNFFEKFDKEVIKYRNLGELAERLEDIFEGRIKENREAAEQYVKENSSFRIAQKFEELFKE